MPLPYTTLDLAKPIKALFTKCVTDLQPQLAAVAAAQAAAVPAQRAPGWKSATGPSPKNLIKNIIEKCFDDCKKEIDKQAAIYVAEEKDYAEVITQLHADAKVVCNKVQEGLAAVQQQWDEPTFQQMGVKLALLKQFMEKSDKYGTELVKHQGFRGNRPWLEPDGIKAIGTENEGALAEYFKAKRAAGVQATAKLGPLIAKIDDLYTRGESCFKAAMALKTKSTAFTKELAAEADKILTHVKKQAGETHMHWDKDLKEMQNFVVLCNQNKNKVDATKLNAAKLAVSSKEMKIKIDKTHLKTLKLEVSNFKSKATGQAVPADMMAKIKQVDTLLVQMEKEVNELKNNFDAFETKVGQAKS
jgi:hypothetical protein